MNGRELVDDARLTAYALGELSGSERREVEALLERDAGARALVEEIRGAARLLERGFAADAGPELTAAQRAAVQRAARAPGGSARRRPMLRALSTAAVAASALALVGVGAYFVLDASGLLPAGMQIRSDAPYTYHIFGDELIVGGRTRRNVDAVESSERGLGERLRSIGYAGSEADAPLGAAPEGLDREGYARIDENPFVLTAVDPRSTFSIDVDTASYSNLRRFLRQGKLPPQDAVRIEELVNYFPYDYAGPTGEHPFAVHVDVVDAPWQPRHRIVRIGLKGREVAAADRRPANLVFLIDVSGSMNGPLRLPLVAKSLRLLVNELKDEDSVAIAVYAGAAGLVLPPTPASTKAPILDALERLRAGGSTAGGAGIELAYRVAEEAFLPGGINRVILATDGDFNVGVTDEGRHLRHAAARLAPRRRGEPGRPRPLGCGRPRRRPRRLPRRIPRPRPPRAGAARRRKRRPALSRPRSHRSRWRVALAVAAGPSHSARFSRSGPALRAPATLSGK